MLKDIVRASLVLSTMIFSLVFLLIPEYNPKDVNTPYVTYLATGETISLQGWFFFLFISVEIAIYSGIMFFDTQAFHVFFLAIFGLNLWRVVDFVLTGNQHLGFISGTPVSTNTLGAVIIGLTILWESSQYHFRKDALQ